MRQSNNDRRELNSTDETPDTSVIGEQSSRHKYVIYDQDTCEYLVSCAHEGDDIWQEIDPAYQHNLDRFEDFDISALFDSDLDAIDFANKLLSNIKQQYPEDSIHLHVVCVTTKFHKTVTESTKHIVCSLDADQLDDHMQLCKKPSTREGYHVCLPEYLQWVQNGDTQCDCDTNEVDDGGEGLQPTRFSSWSAGDEDENGCTGDCCASQTPDREQTVKAIKEASLSAINEARARVKASIAPDKVAKPRKSKSKPKDKKVTAADNEYEPFLSAPTPKVKNDRPRPRRKNY